MKTADVAVILFKEISNEECSEMLSFVDSLSKKYYKSVKFLKVNRQTSSFADRRERGDGLAAEFN